MFEQQKSCGDIGPSELDWIPLDRLQYWLDYIDTRLIRFFNAGLIGFHGVFLINQSVRAFKQDLELESVRPFNISFWNSKV